MQQMRKTKDPVLKHSNSRALAYHDFLPVEQRLSGGMGLLVENGGRRLMLEVM